jgi:hypothetical protein
MLDIRLSHWWLDYVTPCCPAEALQCSPKTFDFYWHSSKMSRYFRLTSQIIVFLCCLVKWSLVIENDFGCRSLSHESICTMLGWQEPDLRLMWQWLWIYSAVFWGVTLFGLIGWLCSVTSQSTFIFIRAIGFVEFCILTAGRLSALCYYTLQHYYFLSNSLLCILCNPKSAWSLPPHPLHIFIGNFIFALYCY